MSNALGRDLARLAAAAERAAAERGHGDFGQRLHVMPPTGWLNDPNGLCQTPDGVFHAFFQYAPFDVAGGLKLWGHAVSRDLLSWDYLGAPLLPDEPYDCHGAYSGSALVEDGRIKVLYTGNVKLASEPGAPAFDYVNRGRRANTVLAEGAWDPSDPAGFSFSAKRAVMSNDDYPADLTCHVRDPKIWRGADGRAYMVQGARRRVEAEPVASRFSALHGAGAGADAGEALVFSSDDLVHWRLENRVRTSERLGFMWECPDYLELPVTGADGAGADAGGAGDAALRVLSISPQGLEGGRWERGNIYQSGYLPVRGDLLGDARLGDFRLWDAGFDFYAPQTFLARDGRRVMIPWMGIPDEPSYGNDPTVAVGWQHCLGIPRELTAAADGTVRQRPVREVEAMRAAGRAAVGTLEVEGEAARCFDLAIEAGEGRALAGCRVTVAGELALSVLPAGDGLPARLEMRFLDASRDAAGCGRTVRWEPLDGARDLRVIGDSSSVEVFAADGALAMSTRIYPRRRSVAVSAPGARVRFWELHR